MTCKELSDMDVYKAVLELFPRAEIVDSADGSYVIDTGCQWTGDEGQNVIGEMNIEGESLS